MQQQTLPGRSGAGTASLGGRADLRDCMAPLSCISTNGSLVVLHAIPLQWLDGASVRKRPECAARSASRSASVNSTIRGK